MYHSFPLVQLLRLINCQTPFVFLDTACPNRENRYSYLFSAPIRILTAKSPAQVPALLRAVDEASKGRWVAGYLTYEAALGLEERLQNISGPFSSGLRYAGWFGVFAKPYIFDHVRGKWNRPLPRLSAKEKSFDANDHSDITLDHQLGESAYKDKIRTIKRHIARGSAYQINFTYDVSLATTLDAFGLYRRLRENQKAPFCSFISTGFFQALSFSPELFFNKRKRRIYVKPMKGTAMRGRFSEEDRLIGQGLSLDAKNRSENVMIVDLMRSDLGKICSIGSVKTTKLFTVEKYRTVHQMTSTVRGTLRPPMTSGSVLKNLFPSGSVTGAPKIKSIEIIHELESGERGVYCGAIGFIGPRGSAIFSVPIRTLQSTSRRGHWKYRVGSGIVWDSKLSEEWRECSAKCRFLTEARPSFELFESILYNARLVYKNDHARRLKNSARYFDYPFDKTRIFSMLAHIEKKLDGFSKQKVRIFLNASGKVRWDYSELKPLDYPAISPRIAISPKPIDERDPLMFHKTTRRPWYQDAVEVIAKRGLFDVIFKNSKGEITEGSRSNVFIKKGKMLYAPPVTCGLLPGVLRENLIRCGRCVEAVLTIKDLQNADAIYCGNSVRGLVEVQL